VATEEGRKEGFFFLRDTGSAYELESHAQMTGHREIRGFTPVRRER
jgi:hypothetical protein